MSLTAGAATRNISPSKPMALYGYPHVERISTGVHDPLLATVILLKNQDVTLVLAALDLLMIEPSYARELRQAVTRAADCAENCVFISCTHTHSGPVTSRLIGWQNDPTIPQPDSDYLDFVKTQVVAAVEAAVKSVVPAELAWTSADATGVGGNRLAAGGVTDPECGVLALRNPQTHDPLALALIYGMHPTVLHEDSTLISADFPYFTRRHLQEQTGREIPIAYHTAPSGNQSPRHFVTGQTFAEAERLGRKLGAAVAVAIDAIPAPAWCAAPMLNGCLATVELPRNPVRARPEAEALLAEYRETYHRLLREQAPRADIRTAECAVFGAEGTVALAQAAESGVLQHRLDDYRPAQVQILRIDDVYLAGLPGECFTEYALEIKRRTPDKTFVVSLVNGELQGYIVTPEAAQQGGYEATNAVFAPESGQILVDTVLAMIAEKSVGPVGPV